MPTNNAINVGTAASGKVLQGAGAGVALTFSTPTYPSASGTSRTILVSDGTNNVYSTETWAVPGSSGNILKSDGTNWTSASSSSLATSYVFTLYCTSSSPVASTTYFLVNTNLITTDTASSTVTRFYIPSAATLSTCYGIFTVGSTLASNQNCSVIIRKNNTTDTNVTTSLQLTNANNTFNGTSLGIAFAAGDYFEIKFVTGAWTTAPLQVRAAMSVFLS